MTTTFDLPANFNCNAASPGRRRILFIDHTAKIGGGEIALLNLIPQLDARRFDITVLLLQNGPLVEAMRAAGIHVQVLPIASDVLETRKDSIGASSFLKLAAACGSVTAIARMARFIARGDYELVHTNSLKADILGGIAARMAGKKVVWHIRDRIDDDYLPRHVVSVFRRLARVIPHFVIANSKAVLHTITGASPSEPAATEAAGLPSSSVVYSGIPLKHSSHVVFDGTPVPNDANGQSAAEGLHPVIVLVGRLAKWKGQHIFIKAAAAVHQKYPDARFQIIGSAMFGEEAYEAELIEQIKQLGLEQVVEMTGFRSDVPALMQRSHLVVHASTTGEPFGQVITEAMALSKPVVATRGGGVPEIVAHAVTGLLVPMGDAPAMAAAIERVLADPAAARAMGQKGYQRVRDHFSIQRTAAGVDMVYRNLLER